MKEWKPVYGLADHYFFTNFWKHTNKFNYKSGPRMLQILLIFENG